MRGTLFKAAVFLILVICFTFGGHVKAEPVYAGNESDCAFHNNCENGGSSGRSSVSGMVNDGVSLGRLIAEGGGYFLQALSETHRFLGLIESSEVTGPDISAIREAVNAAISNAEKAQEIYKQLINLAAVTPYNEVVIDRLMVFDFEGFQKQTGLLPVIFNRVWAYLGTGDVRGIYQRFYDNTGDILDRLTIIKSVVDSGQLPPMSVAWRLNQKCAEYKLFGQYVAEVFYKLK